MIAIRPIVRRFGRLSASSRIERRRAARNSRSGEALPAGNSGLTTRATLDPATKKLQALSSPRGSRGQAHQPASSRRSVDGLLQAEAPLVQRATQDGPHDATPPLAAGATELAQVLERADAAARDHRQARVASELGRGGDVGPDL